MISPFLAKPKKVDSFHICSIYERIKDGRGKGKQNQQIPVVLIILPPSVRSHSYIYILYISMMEFLNSTYLDTTNGEHVNRQ